MRASSFRLMQWGFYGGFVLIIASIVFRDAVRDAYLNAVLLVGIVAGFSVSLIHFTLWLRLWMVGQVDTRRKSDPPS